MFDRIRGYPLFAALRRAGDALKARSQGKALPAGLDAHRDILRKADLDYARSLGHPDPGDVVALASELEAALVAGESVSVNRARAWDAAVDGLLVTDFLKRGLRAEDKYTFVVELEVPFTPFLQNLPMANAAVVPREEVERLGEDFAFRPVGAGPFRFVRWDRGVALELEAFEGYFRGRPWLDRIRYRILPDPVTQLTEFEIGNLDSVHHIPAEKYVDLKERIAAGTLKAKKVEFPLLHVFYLGFNPNKPPFDDVRVRRAFNHAINKELIVKKVLKGMGIVAKGPVPPSFAAYDSTLEGYEFDPGKARALLAEAGFGPENPLVGPRLWYNTATGSDANVQIAEVVQADLAEVGVTLGVEGMAWGTYLERISRCEADMYRLAWLPSHANGDGLLHVLFRTGSASNRSCYSNPKVDKLVDAARSENDQATRIGLYQEAQRLVVDDAIWIPLYHATQAFVRTPKLRGVRLNARGGDAVRWRTVWLDQN